MKRAGSESASPSSKKANKTHDWQAVGRDLKEGTYAGVYGGCNSAWHGLAGVKAGVNMKDYHNKRSKDEFYIPELEKHLAKPEVRACWDEIFTFDPLGLFGYPPTISSTRATMDIPELKCGGSPIVADGDIVNEDLSVNITKCAIDYVWNIPKMAKNLALDETAIRKTLAEYTQSDNILDPAIKTYMPPVGGMTIYFFGDLSKIGQPGVEVAMRVHDSCCGSDVFGTDICTCRPYLVFAIQACVECAQRGGVGVVCYFQKEGRGLGEVIKYRVYNARKAQEGGDCPEKYFYQTESIAGIRDARFQEMMPDVICWLGIKKIDWLLSMSNEKFDAIKARGIEVMQRVSLPDSFIPRNAHVEIGAKVASGYHADSFDAETVIGNLRNLEMVRERCGQIFELSKSGKSPHFTMNLKKMPAVVDYVLKITKRDYPDNKVPYHSRWRHFDEAEVAQMTAEWPCDDVEKARRLVDCATVSVLLDAGAGEAWTYRTKEGKTSSRSEGLAFATMDMFRDGIFSSDPAVPHRVNSHGLRNMTQKQFAKGFQCSNDHNPLKGLGNRFELMQRLAIALEAHPEFFGKEVCRPGNIVDYVLKHVKDGHVSLKVVWTAVIEGLETIWPEAQITGVRRGDVWIYSPLKKIGFPGSDLIPFHKLSQWLTYSLLEPIEQLGVTFDDMNLMTGLAEYRNGGLFVDMGVLTPKSDISKSSFDAGAELIVEWRALTLCLLDQLAVEMRKKLKLSDTELPLAKVLQGGTWAAGRAIAAEKRKDKSSPIQIRSDGTVF